MADATPEVMEAVVTPDERLLRDPPRPVRGETRLLVFAIDGLTREAMLHGLATRGSATARLAGNATGQEHFLHAYFPERTLSILPSSTLAAWATIFTGQPPAHSGIPGNEFFLRDSETFYAIVPTSVSSRRQALEAINDGLANDLLEAPTLYERADLHSHVSLSHFHRGSDLYTKSESALLKLMAKTTISALGSDAESKRAPYAAIDQDSLDSILDGWEALGIPDIQVTYLPGLDLFTHAATDGHRLQARYYLDVIDPLVGKVLDEYERRGALADTWVVFISDHGHTPVMADAEHALQIDDFQALFEDAGYFLRPDDLDVDDEQFTAVLAAQGGMGYLYLANRADCRKDHYCNWAAPPRWREDLQPLLHALDRANRDPERLDGCLDVILARDPAEPDSSFQVWDQGELHEVRGWLDAQQLDHQVEFGQRLEELTDGPRGGHAGEILLVPRYGVTYPKAERCYFAQPQASEHGSGTIEDSRFTLLVAHPSRSGEEIRDLVDGITGGQPRQQHFVPLAMRMLGLEGEPGETATAGARTP